MDSDKPLKQFGEERLVTAAGLELCQEDGKLSVDNPGFGGPAERRQIDFDREVADIRRKTDGSEKQWFFPPVPVLPGVATRVLTH